MSLIQFGSVLNTNGISTRGFRIEMKQISTVVFVILLSCTPILAEGWGFTTGPSVGLQKNPDGGTIRAYGAELTLAYNNIHLNLFGGSSSGGAFWSSLGISRSIGNDKTTRVYTEAGSWMLFCFGGGFTGVYSRGQYDHAGVQLFIGLPLTHSAICNESGSVAPYIHPFYRAHWTLKGHFDFHEIGVMAKIGLNIM